MTVFFMHFRTNQNSLHVAPTYNRRCQHVAGDDLLYFYVIKSKEIAYLEVLTCNCGSQQVARDKSSSGENKTVSTFPACC